MSSNIPPSFSLKSLSGKEIAFASDPSVYLICTSTADPILSVYHNDPLHPLKGRQRIESAIRNTSSGFLEEKRTERDKRWTKKWRASSKSRATAGSRFLVASSTTIREGAPSNATLIAALRLLPPER